jgi:probable rRNA maturation factor
MLRTLAGRAVAAALGDRLAQGGHELRVRIVGDAEMAAAHQRYSGVPGTTDVLTFDLTDGASAATAPLDADVLICLDEARRQSARRGIPIEHELTLYILHAALHCLGEDDRDAPAAARMHAREDAILTSLGLAPVYAAPERAPEGR